MSHRRDRDKRIAELEQLLAFSKLDWSSHRPSYAALCLSEQRISLGKFCEYMRNLRDGKTDDPIVQGVTPSIDLDALRVPAERIAELEAENVRLKAELAEATEVYKRYAKIALHQYERIEELEDGLAALRNTLEYVPTMEDVSLKDHASELVQRYKAVCARLQETAQKHKIGFGGNPVDKSICEAVDRLVAEVAALREDRERLDWLLKYGFHAYGPGGRGVWSSVRWASANQCEYFIWQKINDGPADEFFDGRKAIDAARKEHGR